MCVIVVNRYGSRKLTTSEFNSAWHSNKDGFGIMYSDGENVVVRKAMTRERSLELYNEIVGSVPSHVVSHFRMTTHGGTIIDNVHPFPCGKDSKGRQMWLVHNGIVSFSDKSRPNVSDTRLLCERLEKLPDGWVNDEVYCEMLEGILSWDKVVIMESDGTLHRFGEKGVVMDDGLWASNSTATAYAYTPLHS